MRRRKLLHIGKDRSSYDAVAEALQSIATLFQSIRSMMPAVQRQTLISILSYLMRGWSRRSIPIRGRISEQPRPCSSTHNLFSVRRRLRGPTGTFNARSQPN